MMLPWREARIVGVFGEHAGEALALLKTDARGCGVRAITVVDADNLPCNVNHRQFVRRQREIANAIEAVILIDLRLVGPPRRKAILELADYGVAANAEVSGPRLDLITREGLEIPLIIPEKSAETHQ